MQCCVCYKKTDLVANKCEGEDKKHRICTKCFTKVDKCPLCRAHWNKNKEKCISDDIPDVPNVPVFSNEMLNYLTRMIN
jgi:hypothetical protein